MVDAALESHMSLQGELARCLADGLCRENLICLQNCNGRKDESQCQVTLQNCNNVALHCLPAGVHLQIFAMQAG